MICFKFEAVQRRLHLKYCWIFLLFWLNSKLQVATLILERLLMDDVGLQYVCDSADRLDAVHHALGNVFASLATEPSPRLLKFVIRCYHRFLYDERYAMLFKMEWVLIFTVFLFLLSLSLIYLRRVKIFLQKSLGTDKFPLKSTYWWHISSLSSCEHLLPSKYVSVIWLLSLFWVTDKYIGVLPFSWFWLCFLMSTYVEGANSENAASTAAGLCSRTSVYARWENLIIW